MLDRSQVLGVNQYVNRTAAGRYPLAFANDATGSQLLRDLEKRLRGRSGRRGNPEGRFRLRTRASARGVRHHGIREWLLLVGMDAALPIGTSTGYAAGLKPAVCGRDHLLHAGVERPPGVRRLGLGGELVGNRREPAIYLHQSEGGIRGCSQAGQRQRRGWDPVLDAVGDRTVGWQPDAQQMFKDALRKTATNLSTASAGPYRRPEVYRAV